MAPRVFPVPAMSHGTPKCTASNNVSVTNCGSAPRAGGGPKLATYALEAVAPRMRHIPNRKPGCGSAQFNAQNHFNVTA